MKALRPLLACTIDDLTLLRFPVIASAKLDGIRCVIDSSMAISRNGKEIPNKFVQNEIGRHMFNGLDGELIVGPPSGDGVFNRTTSGVMSIDGVPDFTYWVFDNHLMSMAGYYQRWHSLQDYPEHPRIKYLPQQTVKDINELTNFERDTLAAGFEGVMVRRPDGPYKQGRSTLNEQILLRIKRFRDGEAVVLDIEEGKINNNEAVVNSLGYIERQTLQANMKRAGRVGTLVCQDLATGDKMRISPGRMTQDMRVRYWTFPTLLLNQKIKYKCFDYGAIDAPRFATFQSFLGVAP